MTTTVSNDQRAALELLSGASSLVLVGHVRPDGDCIGAQAALAHGLTSIGKTVQIVNPDPPGSEFDYLAREFPYGVYEAGELPAHDLVCLLDFNDPTRCGAPLQTAIDRAPSKKLVVDHHPPSGGVWWDAAFLDPSASATGLLAYRILRELGAEIDAAVAHGVFTSIVTDTGWFRYSNTDAETMAVVAELLRAGVDPTRVYASIYQRKPRTEPLALGALLARTRYFADDRLAVIDHPLDAGAANDLSDSDTALDVLRAVESVEVVLYVRELEPGNCKLSARSKTAYDVNALARRFGGGGHVKAAGASIQGALPSVVERLVAAALEGFEG